MHPTLAASPSFNREGDVEFVRDLCRAAHFEGLLKGVFIVVTDTGTTRNRENDYLHQTCYKGNFISYKQLKDFGRLGMYCREEGGFIAYERVMPWLPLLNTIPRDTATGEHISHLEWVDFGPSRQRYNTKTLEKLSEKGSAWRTAQRMEQIGIDSLSRPLAFTGHASVHMDLTEMSKSRYCKIRLPKSPNGRVQLAFRSLGEGILFMECYNAEHRDTV